MEEQTKTLGAILYHQFELPDLYRPIYNVPERHEPGYSCGTAV